MAAIKIPFLSWLDKKSAKEDIHGSMTSTKVDTIVPPTDPFENPIFALCVDLTLMACNSFDFYMTDLNGDRLEKPNEQAVNLLRRPNKYYNGKRLINNIVCSYISKGAGYALVVDGAPKEIYFVPFDKVRKEYGDNLLMPIKSIKVDGISKEWEQVIELNALNPNDTRYGLDTGKSKVDALKSTLDTHNIIRMKNAKSIAKYEKLKAIIYEESEHDIERARKQSRLVKEELANVAEGGTAVLFGKLKVENLTSEVEGDFLETYMTMGREICQRLGVPTDMVFGQAKYENLKEAVKAFMKQTIIPIMEQFLWELNTKVYEPSYKCRLEIDYSTIEELQKNVIEYIKAQGTEINRYISTNEYRALMGFSPLEGERHDRVSEEPIAPKGESSKSEEMHKSSKSIDELAQSEEHKLLKKYSAYFDNLYKRIKKQFSKTSKSDDEEDFFSLDDIYNSEVEVELMKATTEAEYIALYGQGWKFIDNAKEKIPKATQAIYLKRIGNHIKAIDETTKEVIQQIILNNKEKGSAKQAKKEILESIKGMSGWRAANIARTETFSALEEGQYDSAKEVGMKYKVWYSSKDERTREAHKGLHGTKIKIDEYFVLNGRKGLKPRDSNFSVGDIVNCRCTLGYTNSKD